jgi:hypothetical protein
LVSSNFSQTSYIFLSLEGIDVILIVWLLDVQFPMQAVPITNVVSSNPAHGEVYSIQHYVIKFVNDLPQVSSFLWFSPTNKTVRHEITEILLKMALNTTIIILFLD